MKKNTQELEVDYIGGQNKPLTIEEQIVISTYIQKHKKKANRRIQIKSKPASSRKASKITN